MEHETNTFQEQELHFRKTASGDIITVTELNTKITYTRTKQYKIGRLIFQVERTNLSKTFAARTRYFLYNNRISRFKRALVPTIKQYLSDHGLYVYIAQ